MEYEQYDQYNVSELDDDPEDEFGNTIIISGYAIAAPLMLVTLIVYSILPELRNIHGQTLRGYIGCQLLALITFLVMMILIYLDVILPCLLYAFFTFFSLNASYLWLNVVCFDIWWTFGGFRHLKKNSAQYERKKYTRYSIYVWGGSFSLTVICTGVEFATGEAGPAAACFVSTKFACIEVPIGFTLLVNLILFILTVKKMIRHNEDTARDLGGTEGRRNDSHKQWFTLYLKLFIVMGINWFLDVISWFHKESKYLQLISALVIPFQGIIIFILFVCKKKILRSIAKRCRCWKPNSKGENSGRRACHSSVSRASTSSVPTHDGITAAADSSPERF